MKNLRSHLKAEGKPPIQHQSSSIVSNAALAREINQIVPSPPQQQPFAVAASTSGGLSIDGQSGKAFGSKKRRGDPTNSHASVSNTPTPRIWSSCTVLTFPLSLEIVANVELVAGWRPCELADP